MKRFFLFFFIIYCALLSAAARTPWLKKPLRYVCADSVITWGYDGRDFRTIAHATDSTVKAQPIRLTRQNWSERESTLATWTSQLSEHNVLGGVGAPQEPSQALGAAKWLNQATQLYLMQGDASYMDYAERALFNAVMRTANDTLQPRGTLDKWLAASLLLATPGIVYATSHDEKALYVNLYTNATTTLTLRGKRFVLDQITNMPNDGGVKFRLSNFKGELSLKLYLRMPSWTGLRSDSPYVYIGGENLHPTLYVNGHEVEPLIVNSQGYVVIERKWHALDEVYIDFPLQVQTILPATTPTNQRLAPLRDHAAFQFGPLVYLPQGNTQGHYFVPNRPPQPIDRTNALGRPILQGTMYRYADLPQDAKAPNVTFWAE